MQNRPRLRHARLMCGAAIAALAIVTGAQAETRISIAPQSLDTALNELGAQGNQQVLIRSDVATGKMTRGVSDAPSFEVALAELLQGTGLTWRRQGDTFLVVRADDPQSGSAAGDGAEVEALIVTAQKREENIQDVPIAISAFTSKDLEEQKIEGGFDLLKAIPNVTFSKNNFTSYNFSIRGIGTKAVSATTDPGVAVSFNNMALLQNRLFEQEYFDVERVEVLRGPQGTLYGRNATAGVINVISAKPDMNDFDGWIKGEVGNYHSKRASAMINIPVVEDVLAVRFAGAFTDRQGYDFNTGTGNAVNGRDLWSARLTVGLNPTDTIRANLIWERFEEDDNRSRTGKQLCKRDPGLSEVGGTVVGGGVFGGVSYRPVREATFSQGCLPVSLYDDEAFGTPNGLALPFVFGMLATGQDIFSLHPGQPHTLLEMRDPYGELMQSRDLRKIDSFRDPIYRAKADVVEFNLDWDITENLTLSAQTAWNKDQTYSFQDFNRFNTLPIFADTSQWLTTYGTGLNPYRSLAPGGIFCDPQLGCSDSLAGFDIAQAKGEQFSQEIRLQSDFEGPINFSVGANYTRFKTLIDYYVFYNLITAYAMISPFNDPYNQRDTEVANYHRCYSSIDFLGFLGNVNEPSGTPGTACPYIDPNPIESINGEGHNYFRSKNPFKLKSSAVFGELYWDVTPDIRMTAGLRYTDDNKTFIPVPSQILLSEGVIGGGTVNRGYPELPPIKQEWGEWTGRLGVDWKPDLAFTDQTLLYATYSHGYKAGGANPPSPGFGTKSFNEYSIEMYGFPIGGPLYDEPILSLTGVDYEPTFEPEFVEAFEIGAKNTLLDGALTLNTSAFLYDYKDYQVSQIRNRTAVNENFDATVWGLELQSVFSPSRDFQVIANIGYLKTRIADGESSIDLMDRTQGNDDLVLAKPWAQIPSNCVVPVWVAEEWVSSSFGGFGRYQRLCGGTAALIDIGGGSTIFDPVANAAYDPRYYDGVNHPLNINGGTGIKDELGGNELPNAPHWTANVGAQYGIDILDGWRATVRGDAYWQSQSWHRVYNSEPYDKLHGWYNVNLSVWFEKPDADLKIELYAKNILDETPITDAFLNSDDTALTTNVFVLDPRLIGLSIRKGF